MPRRGGGGRIAALVVDWLLANLAAFALVRDPAVWQAPVTGLDFVPLAVFAVEVWILTAFVGASVGQRLRHLVVARLDGRPVGLVRAFVRTALILLVVPPFLVGARRPGPARPARGYGHRPRPLTDSLARAFA